jgi:hypothetical protein
LILRLIDEWQASSKRFDNINMANKNSTIIISELMFLIAVVALIGLVDGQCCLGFNGGVCISCPSGMHLFRGSCIYDVAGCTQYQSGFDCLTCRTNYQLSNGTCAHQSKLYDKQDFRPISATAPILQSSCSLSSSPIL